MFNSIISFLYSKTNKQIQLILSIQLDQQMKWSKLEKIPCWSRVTASGGAAGLLANASCLVHPRWAWNIHGLRAITCSLWRLPRIRHLYPSSSYAQDIKWIFHRPVIKTFHSARTKPGLISTGLPDTQTSTRAHAAYLHKHFAMRPTKNNHTTNTIDTEASTPIPIPIPTSTPPPAPRHASLLFINRCKREREFIRPVP